MARLIGSFLIRLWRTARSERIEIEHIQSGEKGLVSTFSDAADWIGARAGDEQPGISDSTHERPDRVDEGNAASGDTGRESR